MNRRHFLIVAGGLATMGAVGAVSMTGALADGISPDAEPVATTQQAARQTASVTRGDLGTVREFRASVSFGDPWALTTAVAGTVTRSLDEGAVVGAGQELIRVDDRPLFLAEGDMPMFRELHKVNTRGRDENGKRLTLQEGVDVRQLQSFLLAAGHDADGELQADGIFGAGTEKAIKAWQKEVGLPITGRVDNSQLVFSPESVRIAGSVRVGSPFESLQVNRAAASVNVETSNRDRAALTPGTVVSVAVPDGEPVEGTVEDQKPATGSDGSRIWRSTVDAGSLPAEASTATVIVDDVAAEDVLLVPASALLALAEGGFAVEVPDGSGTTLVRVSVGTVLEGRAEVEGDIDEGTTVVVPS